MTSSNTHVLKASSFNSSHFQTVIELATRAIEADERGHSGVAVKYYTSTIEVLLIILKETTDPTNRREISEKIEGYMSRAEFLKEKMKAGTLKKPTRSTTKIEVQPKTCNARPSSNKTTAKDGHKKEDAERSKYALMILDEVIDKSLGVHWADIAGLELAKEILQEAVILPALRPDLFTGLRAPPKGVLLFGPPGTGKTLLAKAVATESKATFFSISASSLTSKWVGEGEKLVRALFAMAKELQPSVIFIDEIDSVLSCRSSNEHDASRRLKNQFFVEMDGVATSAEDRVLVMGATNLPQELDDAIIRRLERRVYVPLPSNDARQILVQNVMKPHKTQLSTADLSKIVKATAGFSGSDMKSLCKDASLGPIRELGTRVRETKIENVRPINLDDFQKALKRVRPSVSMETITALESWSLKFGAQSQ